MLWPIHKQIPRFLTVCGDKKDHNGSADHKLARVNNEARYLSCLCNVRQPERSKVSLQRPRAVVLCCSALLWGVSAPPPDGHDKTRQGQSTTP